LIEIITIQQINEYLFENISDPVPKYIFIKEILKTPLSSPEYINAYNKMVQTKWYRELAEEQGDDGSWGQLGDGYINTEAKRKFIHRGMALRRAKEMSLSKDDPMIAKCLNLLEKYIRGEAEQPGRIEVHQDGGKGNRIWRNFGSAMDINMFDSKNLLVKPIQDSTVEILRTAFKSGYFDEAFFYEAEREYRVYILAHPRNACSPMLMHEADSMDEPLQRQYLSYIWGKTAAVKMSLESLRESKKWKREQFPEHIFYMSGFLPISKKVLEEKDFTVWLSLLELLSGFSLFGEFMRDDAYPHLLNEAERLMNGDVSLPKPSSGHVKDCGHDTNGRYAESWRDKNKRITDMVLRIARILVKC